MAHSLPSLKLTTEHSTRCALAGCDENAEVTCKRCLGTPHIGQHDRYLADIAYCTERHLEQDTVAHGDMCAHRRWVRLVGRIGELHHLLFSIERERWPQYALHSVLLSRNGELPALDVVYRHMEPGEPFCGPEVDEDVKLCALYLNHCVHALVLGTGLMAYFSESKSISRHHETIRLIHISEGEIRVQERHSLVDPQIRVQASHMDGRKWRTKDVAHSVFFIAPPFVTAPADPFAEDGIIYDLSGMQFFFREVVDTASNYQAHKARSVVLDERRYQKPLGHAFKQHTKNLESLPAPQVDVHLHREASVRVINKVLFPELDRIEDAEGMIHLDGAGWEAYKERIGTLLEACYDSVHAEIDELDGLPLEPVQIHVQKTKLLESWYGGVAHTKMTALLENLPGSHG
jgi:hypothetical protein